MIVTWEVHGARATFFGVRETATGRLRPVTPQDVALFLERVLALGRSEPQTFEIVTPRKV